MDVIDQKSSNLCVPMSITTLIRFALKNDLYFGHDEEEYTFENIFATLTMIVYPRSMAGLNLNPNTDESEFQVSEVETLLQRVCRKTYLMESGWEIIRQLGFLENQPRKSTCKFEKGNVVFNVSNKQLYFLSFTERKLQICSSADRNRRLSSFWQND